ncbi:hypothetical protein SK128_011059 [Halocaridina rubra]|uniref:Uncharacterized protein n=1 Tax=Halocaridina rubra TaxID=373956 RepID=A0AAN8WDS4_HALRR
MELQTSERISIVVWIDSLSVAALNSLITAGKVGVDTRVARLQAMILPLLMVSVICMVQLSCMYSSSSWAVYLSLTCLVINRSSCWGVGSLFIRARFPVDHFNRIIGIYGSSLALLSLLQCLHLLWLQKHFLIALAFLIGVVLTTFVHPLFLFKKRHLRRVVNELHAERSRKDYLEIE